MFHCKTVSQFKAYQWVKKNFETDLLGIELVDNQTIKIEDMTHETANIQYKNNKKPSFLFHQNQAYKVQLHG